jgi:DNA mismatch repair protein MutH
MKQAAKTMEQVIKTAEQSAKNVKKSAKNVERPTIEEVCAKVLENVNILHNLPKTKNKGMPGNYLENLTGIPTSSACLDCSDGEVKIFPLKLTKSGNYVPKETIAVTMLSNDSLAAHSFEESKVCKKLSKVLYVPYFRNGDIIQYFTPTIIDLREEKYAPLIETLRQDYDAIRKLFVETGALEGSSNIGKYLQNRTKGAGKGAPKTRAYYLRPLFMKDFVEMA